MEIRERRAAHVHPKPPSSDRLKSRTLRSTPPSKELVRRYRPIRTTPQIPWPVGLSVIGVCLILGLLTITVGTGLLGSLVNQVGSAFGNAMAHLSSQAPATVPPSGVLLDTPQFDAVTNGGYTNQKLTNLTGSVPGAALGKTGYLIRIYSIDANVTRHQVADIPVGATTRFVSPEITLVEGSNVFTAVLVTPAGEGQPSPTITYILDSAAPKITVSSPAQSSLQKSASVDVVGKTDPGTTVTIRNEQATSGKVSNQTVGTDGKFKLTVALVAGSNTIDIAATDQAGNVGTYTLTVKRDFGQLAVHLVVTPAKFAASSQVNLKLTIHATAANGSPLANAKVIFTVTANGLGAIVSPQMTTDATGTATWSVAISGATPGQGQASVLVTSSAGDIATGSTRITTT